eukprot:Nitzschia sp. Nitz4//scaffold27_size158506//151866//152462//NITZ4_002626-RA/size158506-processed-gene-0.61-mRNA-1//1//CDS//3329545566//6513//frame0
MTAISRTARPIVSTLVQRLRASSTVSQTAVQTQLLQHARVAPVAAVAAPNTPFLRWFSDKSSTTDDSTIDQVNEKPHPVEDLQGERSQYTVPITIRMPDMNEDENVEQSIEEWFKQPGDIIKKNDVLCDISTPDFTFGMVTDDDHDAIMGEIHVQAGEFAADNSPICTIYHPEPVKEEELVAPDVDLDASASKDTKSS